MPVGVVNSTGCCNCNDCECVTITDYEATWGGFQVAAGGMETLDMPIAEADAGTSGTVALEIDLPAGILVYGQGVSPGVVRITAYNTTANDFPVDPAEIIVHFKIIRYT